MSNWPMRWACRRRPACGGCKLLEEPGVIDRYVAVLDGPQVGLGLTVFARVWFKTQDAETTHQFAETVRGNFPKWSNATSPPASATPSCASSRPICMPIGASSPTHLMRIPSVQSVKTDVPMETIKREF